MFYWLSSGLDGFFLRCSMVFLDGFVLDGGFFDGFDGGF